MTRFTAALFGMLMLQVLVPTSSHAGICDEMTWGQATGPVALGLLEGGLGEGRRACGRSEVGIAAGGMLLVDLPNFYGRLSADLRLRGSWAINDALEVYARFEFFRFDQLITPLTATSIGIGHTNVGVSGRFLNRDKVALAVHGQLVLPTAVPLYSGVHPLGMDLALAGQFKVHRKIQLHADVGVIHSVGIGGGPALPRIGATITGGAEFRPVHRFAIVTDLHASFGYTAPLDMLAAALALRFADGKRFGFDFGATIPLAGRERANVRLDLLWTLRLGPITEAPPDRKGKGTDPALAPANDSEFSPQLESPLGD